MSCHSSCSDDRALVQIVDAALADAAQRSGKWLKCGPGCSQCCIGVFAINQLDAHRLREGLAELELQDPTRAIRLRERVRQSVERLSAGFLGNPITGVLEKSLDKSPEAAQRWDDFANDEVCPVLDPDSGTCDLYRFRPITCRIFGPPVEDGDNLGVCELCFDGAPDEDVAAAEMNLDFRNLETTLNQEAETKVGIRGETIVAFALAPNAKA